MSPRNGLSGKIIAFRNDRLGGRLVMMVNALRLSLKTGAPFRIHWHQGSDLAAVINDPTEFFDRDFVAEHFIDRQEFLAARSEAVHLAKRPDLDLAGVLALLEQGTNMLVEDGIGVRTLPGEDAGEIAKHCAAIWREIPLASTVAKLLAEIRTTIGPQTTAYHIRRGDILTLPRVTNRPWPNKYVFDEVYEIHIEQTVAQGERPIIFSDDEAVVARLRRRFPDLIPAATLFDRKSVTAGQADFLELLALASCNRIIGPPQSAFSSGAATLGEVPLLDVGQSLTPAQRHVAGERLLARLRDPARQEDLTAGDIGQSYVHLDSFMASNGRLPEFCELLDRDIRSGLDLSFLYPRLIELHLLADRPDAAVAAAELMQTRQVYHRPDFANGQMLHALAQLGLGRASSCATLANIAFWHDTSAPLVTQCMGALYSSGQLNDGNALPLSPAAGALWLRPASHLPAFPAASILTSGCAMDAHGRVLVPSTDPLTWDWAPIMRSFPRHALSRHRQRAVYERNLARLAAVMPGPDLSSLVAVYDMHVGETDTWLERLKDLSAEFADHAMVQHRLSLAALQARDFKLAATAAERAAELAPDVPAHLLWRSITRLRQKQFRLVMADIRSALDAGLVFPGMYLRFAQAAGAAGHPNAEIAAITEGIAIAPRDISLRFYRAQRRYANGDIAAARADLEMLIRNDIVPEAVMELHRLCQIQ